jgi:hypothetical protein
MPRSRKRCPHPRNNLVATIAATTWRTIEAQFNRGNGGELAPIARPSPQVLFRVLIIPLAVNCFGPFAGGSLPLPMPGVGTFGGGAQFEAQRSAGTPGYKPNLDLVAEPAELDTMRNQVRAMPPER